MREDAACDNLTRVDTLATPLREASGIAASRSHPGILWVHNDGGNENVVFAIDTAGHVNGRVHLLTQETGMDWEDIAVSDCGDRDCIYLADIGDNLANRSTVRILRLHEPDPRTDSVAQITGIFHLRYPDGPHDAEAMFVLPGGRVFVITKGRNGPVALFAYPGQLRADTVTLRHIQDFTPGLVQLPLMATGAAASADGRRIAIRSYSELRFYRPGGGDSLIPVSSPVSLASLLEFQGEGIALAPSGSAFLVGEVGFDTVPPHLSRLTCR